MSILGGRAVGVSSFPSSSYFSRSVKSTSSAFPLVYMYIVIYHPCVYAYGIMPFVIFAASFNFLGINNLSSYKFIIMGKFFVLAFDDCMLSILFLRSMPTLKKTQKSVPLPIYKHKK